MHTLITDEFRGTQVGTAHFKHLEDERSSMLVIARSFEEHAELLERSLRGELPDRNDGFVRMFVRPHGLDVPATPLYVEAIEELAAAPAPEPDGGPLLAPMTAVRDATPPPARRSRRRAAPGVEARVTGARAESRYPAAVAGSPAGRGRPMGRRRDGRAPVLDPVPRPGGEVTLGLAHRLCIIAPLEARAWYAGSAPGS